MQMKDGFSLLWSFAIREISIPINVQRSKESLSFTNVHISSRVCWRDSRPSILKTSFIEISRPRTFFFFQTLQKQNLMAIQ